MTTILSGISDIPDDEYNVTAFESLSIIDSLHAAPRGGKSDDISILASSQSEYSNDYAQGVAFLPIILVLIFFVWLVIIVLMRFFGESLGCTASSKKANILKSKKNIDIWNTKVKRAQKLSIFYSLCGALAMIVFVSIGLTGLDEALNDFKTNLISLQDLLDFNDNIEREFINSANNSIVERDTILTEADLFCPAAGDGVITVTSGDGSVTEIDFDDALKNYTDGISYLQDFLYDASTMMRTTIATVKEEANAVESDIDETESWWYYVFLAFSLLYLALDIYFMLQFIMSICSKDDTEPFHRVNTKVAFSLFSFVVCLSWLISASFIFLAILSSDVCYNNPEENMVSIIGQYELQWGTFLHDIMNYYVEGCTLEMKPEKPTQFYDNFVPALKSSSVAGTNLLSIFDDVFKRDLDDACQSNATTFLDLVYDFQQTLSDMDKSTNNEIQLWYCSNFNPLYIRMMHETICDPGVDSVAKASFTLLSASICGMLLLAQLTMWRGSKTEKNTLNTSTSKGRDKGSSTSSLKISQHKTLPPTHPVDKGETSEVDDTKENLNEKKPKKSLFNFMKKSENSNKNEVIDNDDLELQVSNEGEMYPNLKGSESIDNDDTGKDQVETKSSKKVFAASFSSLFKKKLSKNEDAVDIVQDSNQSIEGQGKRSQSIETKVEGENDEVEVSATNLVV